ncbi:MAG: hypothetical protein U9N49_12440 [Campylobacterota bacterium]|nr:hypothetical protein [Campylobacterota bacterium]
MTKKIMSAAAAAVLMTSGAFAFDTDPNGTLMNLMGDEAVYNLSNVAVAPLQRSFDSATDDRMTGDALIFPAFKMNENWETEVVFRNNYADRAVVAKVVLYRGSDTKEVIDFNVYLSANDQVRFVLDSEQKLKTSDASVAVLGPIGNNDATQVQFASDIDGGYVLDIKKFLGEIGGANFTKDDIEDGYIAVYGLFETNLAGYTGDVTNINGTYPDLTGTNVVVTDNGFDHKHRELWQLYRKTMDDYRTAEWRTLRTTMQHGVYTLANPFPAPNLADNSGVLGAGDGVQPVGQNALSGSVRIYSSANAAEPRDMILPATALANYSDANTLFLWAPTENASIGDRCIDVDNINAPDIDANAFVDYNKACIQADTVTFLVDNAVYTFKNEEGGSAANTLLITQPTKRFLAQLTLDQVVTPNGIFSNSRAALGVLPGNAADYWTFNSTTCPRQLLGANNTPGVFDGPEYGINADLSAVFDDDENTITSVDNMMLISPYNNITTVSTHCDELVALNNIELTSGDALKEFAQDKNGFIKVDFNNATANTSIPAIITQMKATRVNGVAQTNWFYAPSNR